MTFFLLGIFLLALLSIVIWTYITGISPMPTSPKVKKKLLDALPSSLHGTIVELGSGWATLAAPLAKKYPDCQVYGYETSPIPYLYGKIVAYTISNLHMKRLDFFTIKLYQARLVVCYLYPKAMQKLKGKFDEELLSGTYVVSHTFAVPGWV